MDRYELVIVANRLPVSRVTDGDRSIWQTSPGGLVSALTPILQDRPSAWIGWGGDEGAAPEPFDHDSIHNVPVSLDREEIQSFYEGFSNRTLWPLYHDAIRMPEYHRRWWWPYEDVNRRFARVAADITAPGGIVWVHDYHLQLVPSMLRAMRPDLRIGFFLHIPFPPQELFMRLPWRKQILEGLLGADVIGFQTQGGATNFMALAQRFTDASQQGDGELGVNGRTCVAGAFPISIDFHRFEKASKDPAIVARSNELRDKLGKSRRIVLGVDRLDYTKGIDIRLHAIGDLLRSERLSVKDIVLVQTAVPSRERVEEYRQLKLHVEQLVGAINGEFGQLGMSPVEYLHRNLPFEELVALYLAADVMLVTPLRDGMNLVAKEYAATRADETGVLILSEFTGSAEELQSAMLVNPHDLDGLATSIETAFRMDPVEQKNRMHSIRETIRNHDVFAWARSFFRALNS